MRKLAAAGGAVLALPLAVGLMVESEEVGGALAFAGMVALLCGGVALQLAAGLRGRRAGGPLLRPVAVVTVLFWAAASVVLWSAWMAAVVGRTPVPVADLAVFGLGAVASGFFTGACTGALVVVVVKASTTGRRPAPVRPVDRDQVLAG